MIYRVHITKIDVRLTLNFMIIINVKLLNLAIDKFANADSKAY